MTLPMTAEQANAVYDILAAHAGASDDAEGWNRKQFVFHQTSEVVLEYRFQGALGFGGKFRRSGWDDRWYVDCYEEDLTDERRAMIEAANSELAKLRSA